jgi:hypothetical protein
MKLSNIQKISLFMIPVFIILFMSYQHSKVIEGATGSKSSGSSDATGSKSSGSSDATGSKSSGSSDAKNQSYKNAARVDEYLKNQCTNEQIDEMSTKLNEIADQMQDQNEKLEMSN